MDEDGQAVFDESGHIVVARKRTSTSASSTWALIPWSDARGRSYALVGAVTVLVTVAGGPAGRRGTPSDVTLCSPEDGLACAHEAHLSPAAISLASIRRRIARVTARLFSMTA